MKLMPIIMVILAVVSYFATKRKSSPHKSTPAAPEVPVNPVNALKHHDWHVREAAVRALGQSGDPNALTDLAAALNDDDDDVREAARQTLESLGAVAVPALLDMLNRGRLEARELAAKALGVIADQSAVPGLVEALTDKSMWVRVPAAEALGIMGAEQAIPNLITALRDDETEVQRSAAEALRRIGTPEAQKALRSYTHT